MQAIVQKPSMNDVLRMSLQKVAEMAEDAKIDEGLAGYLAGYLDRIRHEKNEKRA